MEESCVVFIIWYSFGDCMIVCGVLSLVFKCGLTDQDSTNEGELPTGTKTPSIQDWWKLERIVGCQLDLWDLFVCIVCWFLSVISWISVCLSVLLWTELRSDRPEVSTADHISQSSYETRIESTHTNTYSIHTHSSLFLPLSPLHRHLHLFLQSYESVRLVVGSVWFDCLFELVQVRPVGPATQADERERRGEEGVD